MRERGLSFCREVARCDVGREINQSYRRGGFVICARSREFLSVGRL